MTAMEMNKCPLFFLIPEVWELNEGHTHSPKRDHDGFAQCEPACCEYWSFMGQVSRQLEKFVEEKSSKICQWVASKLQIFGG